MSVLLNNIQITGIHYKCIICVIIFMHVCDAMQWLEKCVLYFACYFLQEHFGW